MVVEPPDLPELEPVVAPSEAADDSSLMLEGVLLEPVDREALDARRFRIIESELRGVTLHADDAPGAVLRDVILRDCDLSNVDAREGSIRRVEIRGSRLVGFALAGGEIQDLRVLDSSLTLASLAFAKLRSVVFERVDLTEVSFMEAQLDAVELVDCTLRGADFRKVKMNGCAIRGSTLDGVLGVEYLNRISMPWPDVLASAGAFATALGIHIEGE